MKSLNLLSSILLLIIFISSCKKSNNDQGQTPVKSDTLSSGWTKIKVNQYVGIFYGGDIFFNNNTVGYVSDNNSGLFKSTDGGATWNQVLRNPSVTAANMAITTDNKAFFVSQKQDSIYRTLDGGATITGYATGGAKLSDIFLADNNTGLSTTNNGLLSTTNGGNTWNNISPLPNLTGSSSLSLFMFNNTNAWVVYDKNVFHANGNLNIWQLDTVATNVPNIGLVSVFATSASVVYVSSFSGYLFKSTNGGVSFTLLQKLNTGNPDYTNYFSDLHFIDANTGYMSVGSRIYKTMDAGNTWSVIVALGTTGIVEIHFSDSSHGWANCADGTILKFN